MEGVGGGRKWSGVEGIGGGRKWSRRKLGGVRGSGVGVGGGRKWSGM